MKYEWAQLGCDWTACIALGTLSGLVFIGSTADPRLRISRLRCDQPNDRKPMSIVTALWVPKLLARRVVDQVKTELHQHVVDHWWFDVSPDRADAALRRAAIDLGVQTYDNDKILSGPDTVRDFYAMLRNEGRKLDRLKRHQAIMRSTDPA